MSFTVEIRPSGRTFQAEAGEPILGAAIRAGVNLPYSCRVGVCSSCKSRVASGTVDHGSITEAHLPVHEREQGFTLPCMARASSDLVIEAREVEGLASAQPRSYPARVVEMRRVAPDVMVVVLRMPLNEVLPFRAGQYVQLQLPDGCTRSYSIANRPDAHELPHLEFHIRHVPGGSFTDRLFRGAIKLRDMVRLQAPWGTFFLRDADRPAILLASGTGFAPIRSIVEDALHRGVRRSLHIYWGGRRRADLYADDMARGWAQRHDRISYTPVLSAPVDGGWTGRIGHVHAAVIEDWSDLSGTEVYACGGPRMVAAARRDFTERCGLPAVDFHADAFLTASEKAGDPIPS